MNGFVSWRNLPAVVSLVVIGVVVAAAVLAPWLAPYGPLDQDIAQRLQGSSTDHWLGTDQFGRDVLSRLMWGARAELTIALGATAIALIVGTLIGLLSGYLRGVVEWLGMRSMDLVLAFPPLILALLVVALRGPGTGTLIVVLGVLFIPNFARVTYSQVLSVRGADYVDASRVLGASSFRILFRVVLPNSAAPVLAQISLTIAAVILLESGLSFLGLGVVPPEPSWGSMVADAQRYMVTNPGFIAISSATVLVTILAFSLAADSLRDLLDPRRAISGRKA
ncbi:ABC transporter permease [Polymorphospora sp. NPDC050346]|uniref:ABC transporter permease n=1 Tax=Polymorphospora sp. NPDC050346 TaxID=3155780 RepID=UPI0033C46E36